MLTKQRRQLILNTLKRDGEIIAATLSADLSLSEDTIRRDLRALAAAGLLQRVHGGALPLSPALADLSVRRQIEPDSKLAIARCAARMVQPGQIVFIDGGTSCQLLVRHLPAELQATVVTHSPAIAVELAGHAGIEVVLIGGRLYKHSMVAVGAAAMDAIGQVRADLYFMGVTGISAGAGLCTGDLEEAHIKRALIRQAAETWVLASPEKLHAASAYFIAPCASVAGVIVEGATPKASMKAFVKLGLGVRYA